MAQQYQDTFKRYELKYLVNPNQYSLLIKGLEKYMTVDKYGRTTICNIYMDTSSYELIRRSIEKPVYKEKLRIRTYGVPDRTTAAFVELKKKYKKMVYKRRVNTSYEDAYQWIINQKETTKEGQIVEEIQWFCKLYQELVPSMVLCYERVAMYGKEDPNLRITFDDHIRWRCDDLTLYSGTEGRYLLQEGEHLMEIKIANSMPLWLVELLDQLSIYPISFSKYGRAYMELEEQKKREKERMVG